MLMQFPSSFLWGASLSSYQSEGGNTNSDWYLWEKERSLEPCKLACDHYRLFDSDFKLAKGLNLNSLRISLEWARVCPEAGKFCEQALEHYSKVIASLHKHKLKPVVTLHHFTNPLWFSEASGWLSAKNIDFFLGYLRKIVETLEDKVDTWLIFNEPSVYIYQGFIAGLWPPGVRSFIQARKVLANILAVYSTGYDEIKRIYAGSSVAVSLAKNLRVFSGCWQGVAFLNSWSSFLRSRYFNWQILNYLAKRSKLDFIGLNYYCKEYDQAGGLFGTICSHRQHQERQNYLGWDIYPEGLYNLLISLKRFNLPIVITENGTAEREDKFYQQYLIEHLRAAAKALAQGVKLTGYFWWSLLDNFEWDKGFGPRFGLFEVDYKSFKRRPRKFSEEYAKICLENKLEI